MLTLHVHFSGKRQYIAHKIDKFIAKRHFIFASRR